MKILCACNGKKCDGICRKEHLNFESETPCTSAYYIKQELQFRIRKTK